MCKEQCPSEERPLVCELLPSLSAFLSLQIKLLSMSLLKCFSRQLGEPVWKKQSMPMEYTLPWTAWHSALLVKQGLLKIQAIVCDSTLTLTISPLVLPFEVDYVLTCENGGFFQWFLQNCADQF